MNVLPIFRKRVDESNLQLEGISVEIQRRAVGYYRLLFFSNTIVLILPPGKNARSFLNKNRQKINRRYNKYLLDVRRSKQLPLKVYGSAEFEDLCQTLLNRFARELSQSVPELKFRKMKRRWGSCRSDGRITLNRCLSRIPEHLIAYVIYHEVLHLQIPNHGRVFKECLQGKFPERKQLDYELKLYGMRLLCDTIYE